MLQRGNDCGTGIYKNPVRADVTNAGVNKTTFELLHIANKLLKCKQIYKYIYIYKIKKKTSDDETRSQSQKIYLH